MDNQEPTLCFPDSEKSCFACCPPIRPKEYEHAEYRIIIRRMLRENTSDIEFKKQKASTITGFSCWALGYLDKEYRQVGCLLHPGQNQGQDLRYLVGYGQKCRRESCQEARVFLELGKEVKEFWLRLAQGLDSFSYSSRAENPLFKMMGWGSELLTLIAHKAGGENFDRQTFFSTYPIFSSPLNSRANAYLLQRISANKGAGLLKDKSFRYRFEAFSAFISAYLKGLSNNCRQTEYTHLLEADCKFLDFLRLSLGIRRTNQKDVMLLKNITDATLEEFLENSLEGRFYALSVP